MSDFIAHYESQKSRERILTPVVALLIEGKKRGLPTALITSKNREELNNTLPRLEIADYVDLAVTADDVAHPKPDPEGLLQALKRLGATAASAVYTGDTVHDMRAARGAGVRGIGVTWGAASRPLLEKERPTAICDTVDELRAVLFGGDPARSAPAPSSASGEP
jgi:HAD superfamily hydrolase (TIGR01509 family)